MADIRIKDLATTAASTASDDFVAVDGSANGTRKLNAYSPTFGGNLTVSGTSTLGNTATLTGAYFKTKPSSDDGTLTGFALGNSSNLTVAVSDVNTLTGEVRVGGTNANYFTNIYSKSVAVLQFGASSAATLAGNLTVSGTGGAAIAKGLTVNKTSLSTDRILEVTGTHFGTSSSLFGMVLNPTYPATTTANAYGLYLVPATTASSFTLTNAYSLYIGDIAVGSGSTVTNKWAIYHTGTNPSSIGGNFLIGTTVDSGALLQVGTNTTTSAGGMVFGTDTSLFRITTGGIALSDNGTRQTNFYCDSGGSYIGSNDTRSLFLRTNNTTALTLDSSQNATFAGTIKAKTAASLTNLSFCFSANTSTGLYGSASNAFSAIAGGAEVVAFAKDNLGSTGPSMYVANLTVAPTNNPAGGGCLYVEGGALKYRGSSGTVTTIANA